MSGGAQHCACGYQFGPNYNREHGHCPGCGRPPWQLVLNGERPEPRVPMYSIVTITVNGVELRED